MAYRKKRTIKRRFAKKRTMKKRGVRRPSIKKMIRREIARNIEDKHRQLYVQDYNLLGSADVSTFDDTLFPLTPYPGALDIQQGTGQGARIGNKIKTKRLMFKGSIVPLAYNALTNPLPQPFVVKMWIFYDKTFPTTEPTPAVQANFFQLNNSVAGFSNDLVDLWGPVNTDVYRVLTTRMFKVGNSEYQSAAGGSVGSQYGANNDFKLNCPFSINLTKMVPQFIRYNDNSSDPTTRGLYCLCQVVRADGGPVVAGAIMARMSFILDYTYEDA